VMTISKPLAGKFACSSLFRHSRWRDVARVDPRRTRRRGARSRRLHRDARA
jgi:hypothetical protein